MKTIIFGGTTEGREQAALALARGESVLVSVTSEYARQFLPEGAACHIGALTTLSGRYYRLQVHY